MTVTTTLELVCDGCGKVERVTRQGWAATAAWFRWPDSFLDWWPDPIMRDTVCFCSLACAQLVHDEAWTPGQVRITFVR